MLIGKCRGFPRCICEFREVRPYCCRKQIPVCITFRKGLCYLHACSCLPKLLVVLRHRLAADDDVRATFSSSSELAGFRAHVIATMLRGRDLCRCPRYHGPMCTRHALSHSHPVYPHHIDKLCLEPSCGLGCRFVEGPASAQEEFLRTPQAVRRFYRARAAQPHLPGFVGGWPIHGTESPPPETG